MDFIPQYIKGKNATDTITYDCPQLEPILKPTYGCIVYQEQVMQIVRDLGGYTLGRSDLVRRAMSKKKQSVMEKERKNFVYGNEEEGVPGCVSKGISESVANHIYDEMMDFAKYAFNKSHAAAYAVVAYQTAWLKYYYPVEFMAALMTSVIDNFNKVSFYIYTCRSMGIRILPPDINEGVAGFSVSGNDIRYGLASIKGVGWPVIEGMVKERSANGPFKSLKDFIYRLSGDLNKRIIENFIKAGAMDTLPGTRKQKMAVYSQIMDSVTSEKKSGYEGQMTLFDIIPDEGKEDYFLRRLKEEQFIYDSDSQTAIFLPSREDSYDRLIGEGEEFAADQSSVEDKAIAAVMVDQLSENLTSQEIQALYLRYALDWTEDAIAKHLGMERMQYRRMMADLLSRSKNILEGPSNNDQFPLSYRHIIC